MFLLHNSALGQMPTSANNAKNTKKIQTKPPAPSAYERAGKMAAGNNLIAASNLYWESFEKDQTKRVLVMGKLSDLYRQNNQTDKFIRLLEDKLTKLPFDYALNKQLAFEYYSSGKTEKAVQRIQVALADRMVEVSAYSLAAEIFFSSKDYDDCVIFSGKALQEKFNSNLLLLRSECFINLKNDRAAQSDLGTYLKDNPASQKTYSMQNIVYELSGDSEKAEKNLQLCLAQIPNSEACFTEYLKKYGVKNNVWSSQHFEANMNSFLPSQAVLKLMAQIYSSNPRPPTETVLLKLIDFKPTDYVYYKQLFEFYRKSTQPQKAFDLVQRYLALNPQSAEAKADKESLFSNKKVEASKNKEIVQPSAKSKAQDLYENAKYAEVLRILRSTKPKGPKEFFRSGNVMFNLQNYKSAIKNWSLVSKKSPLYEDAILNKAIAFRMQGMLAEATKTVSATKFSAGNAAKAEKIASLFAAEKGISGSELKNVQTKYNNLINLAWGAE
jgi:tetratricopeptide (TPR) repeat protein